MEHQIDYKAEIAKEMKRLMSLEHNKEAADKFNEVLSKIKPKTCRVKSGWCAGSDIDFSMAYDKDGDKDPFDLFIDNIERLEETFGFIFGLYPKKFHFNPITYVSDEENHYLTFKLIKE